MNKLVSSIGVGIFWAAWPLWYVYFKFQPERSRVLVVAGKKVLLLRGWISGDRFSLAGGGRKRGETAAQAAARELREETGIDVPESALQVLGRQRCRRHGFSYSATYFVLRLDEKPTIRPRRLEITEAYWVPLSEAQEFDWGPEVRFALKRYRPVTQESLL